MANIDKINRISKKKTSKSYRIMEFLWSHYQQKDKPRIFYRFKKKWMNFTVRELANAAACSVGMVNKTLNLLKSEDLIEYEFISFKGYGKRITTHDNKCIFFTAKGRAIFSEIFPENYGKSVDDLKGKKEVNTIDPKAVKLNNYNINKSAKADKKVNYYATESLCAKMYDEIERLNIPVKRNKATARYIHAAANKLACNRKIGVQIPTTDLIARFRKYLEFRIKWLKQNGYKICLNLLLKFKAIGAFLAKLFAPYYSYSKYEKPVKLLPKRKILLDGEEIINDPDKYRKYCELYGKENIQVRINGKQVACLPLKTLYKLCGKENVVIIEKTPKSSKYVLQNKGSLCCVSKILNKIMLKF